MLFILLWVTFIYFPIAHWVWYIAAPDDVAAAAKAVAAATDAAAKTAAQAKLDDLTGAVGWLAGAGALDFAGGTVVHINAGIAGLVGALIIGKRTGYGKDLMAPHSLTMTMIGASLLWVGWFGFNAGSNLESNGVTALAFVNTMVATAGAALSWLLCEWIVKGKPSLLGICSGAVAGLVAVTPASGFAGPIGALILGLVVSPICLFFVSAVKNALGYDDALDVFGVHCIGGIIGALGTGILVNPALGGVGITDYTNITGNNAGTYDLVTQMIAQCKAVGATLLWSGIGSAILYKFVDVIVGLRPSVGSRTRRSRHHRSRRARLQLLSSPGARPSRDGRAQNYGPGTYPAMPWPLRGSSASWSPFLFAGAAPADLGQNHRWRRWLIAS